MIKHKYFYTKHFYFKFLCLNWWKYSIWFIFQKNDNQKPSMIIIQIIITNNPIIIITIIIIITNYTKIRKCPKRNPNINRILKVHLVVLEKMNTAVIMSVDVVKDIYRILLCTLISKQNMMVYNQKEPKKQEHSK
jgi:L-lactate permease